MDELFLVPLLLVGGLLIFFGTLRFVARNEHEAKTGCGTILICGIASNVIFALIQKFFHLGLIPSLGIGLLVNIFVMMAFCNIRFHQAAIVQVVSQLYWFTVITLLIPGWFSELKKAHEEANRANETQTKVESPGPATRPPDAQSPLQQPSASSAPTTSGGSGGSAPQSEAQQSQNMMQNLGGASAGSSRSPTQIARNLETPTTSSSQSAGQSYSQSQTSTQHLGDVSRGDRPRRNSVQRLGETFKKPETADSPAASPSNLSGVAPTDKPNVVVCTRDLDAFDPALPSALLGKFLKDSLLTIGEKDAASGLISVTYQDKDGNVTRALCKPQDLGR